MRDLLFARRMWRRRPPLKRRYDVVIIGGGVQGLATAYYLAKHHGITDVAVLEQGYIGSGGSGRNTAIVRSNYRTPEGAEKVAVVPEGHCLYQPPFVPHSPRFAPDAFQLVVERKRQPGEIDRFHWFCPSCDQRLHEETFVVSDYGADPVSRAYDNFFGSLEFRTCKACGTVAPAP